MSITRRLAATLLCLYTFGTGASIVRADECEDVIVRHMIGEALLTAHLVAMAEKAGVKPSEINAILKEVADKSAHQEFWVTNSTGHAYLTNTGVDFTFSSDPAKQPQASAFWPLIAGGDSVVIQDARKREIDDRMFKYVGVAGSTNRGLFRSVSDRNACPAANSPYQG